MLQTVYYLNREGTDVARGWTYTGPGRRYHGELFNVMARGLREGDTLHWMEPHGARRSGTVVLADERTAFVQPDPFCVNLEV
jgi:hypothetical protein